MYSSKYNGVLSETAAALGMQRDWLFNVISLESNWNPAAYNRSGAVGLIQFMPDTLKGMGLLSPALAARVRYDAAEPEDLKQAIRTEFTAKFPDVESQLLGPVRQYFKGRKYPTEQSVYLQVFYPKYASVPPSTEFPANVQAQNPGIRNVQDYITLVQSRSSQNETVRKGLPLVALAALGVSAYFLMS